MLAARERAPAWRREHPAGSRPVAGAIAVPPDDAPGAVEPAPQTAHRPLTRRQNPEDAHATAIQFPIPAGLVRLPFARFVLICLEGRSVRFGALAAMPALGRLWLG